MWPYFALLLVIIFLQIKKMRMKVLRSKIDVCFEIGIIVLFFFAAFRGNGKGDYFTYLSRGKDIDSLYNVMNNYTQMEIGYCFLYWIVNKLHLPSQCIIIFMNTISLLCTRAFINKYSYDKTLSLLLFMPLYFQFDMHAARTAVAISISLMSVKYALNRDFIKFVIAVLMASLFHKTGVIALGLYILPFLKIDWAFSFGIVLFGIFLKTFISVDMLVYKIMIFLGMDSFALKYIYYVNSETYGYPFKLYDPRLLLLLGIYFIAGLTMKNKNLIENFMMNCCLANIVVLVLFSEHTFIAYRMMAFFNVYTIILIPQILYKMGLKSKIRNYKTYYIGDAKFNLFSRILTIGVYALYSIAMFYNACGVPYKIFLFNN